MRVATVEWTRLPDTLVAVAGCLRQCLRPTISYIRSDELGSKSDSLGLVAVLIESMASLSRIPTSITRQVKF
jgi:hypothetical protein